MTGIVLGLLLALASLRRLPPRNARAVLAVPVLFLAVYAGLLRSGASYSVFLTGAAIVLGATLLRPGQRVHSAPPQPFLVAGALVLYLAVRDVLSGAPLSIAMIGGASAALLLWMLRRALSEGDLTAGLVAWWSSAFLSLCLITGGLTGREWIDCRYEYGKCTVAGRIYIGIFPSENVLGAIAAATALLCIVAWRSRRIDLFRVSVLSAILLLAGSRTPLLALVAAIGCAVVLTANAREVGGRWRLPLVFSRLLPYAIATTGIVLVFRASGSGFSNRAAIWSAARSFVSPFSLIGLGENRYRVLGELGTFRGHYPHSEYLLLLFFGGLLALVLHAVLFAMIGTRLRGMTRADLARRTVVWSWLLLSGLVDVSWSPAHVDANVWTLVAALALLGLPVMSPAKRLSPEVVGDAS
ncbi:MAG: hypothetical protein JWN46_1750 [Acidimicrobiales bacterium]|nr:hypothetical protein [Acidimicrobiales bacterium]